MRKKRREDENEGRWRKEVGIFIFPLFSVSLKAGWGNRSSQTPHLEGLSLVGDMLGAFPRVERPVNGQSQGHMFS